MREEIPGVFLIEHFVTKEEERKLIEENKKENENKDNDDDDDENNEEDTNTKKWKVLSSSKRRVRHYGKKFDYDTRDAVNDADEKIPELLDVDVRKRLAALTVNAAAPKEKEMVNWGNEEGGEGADVFFCTGQNANDDAWTEDERRQISEAIKKVVAFDQVTVNEYPPGCGIAPHVDTHSAFTETILSLSLGDRCVIEFRHPNPNEEDHSAAAKNTAAVTAAPAAQQNKNENSDDAMVFPHRALELPRRSLLILTDFARFNRQHYIPKRKSDPMIDGTRRMRTETRYSFTIRQTINNDNINTTNNNNGIPSDFRLGVSSRRPPERHFQRLRLVRAPQRQRGTSDRHVIRPLRPQNEQIGSDEFGRGSTQRATINRAGFIGRGITPSDD